MSKRTSPRSIFVIVLVTGTLLVACGLAEPASLRSSSGPTAGSSASLMSPSASKGPACEPPPEPTNEDDWDPRWQKRYDDDSEMISRYARKHADVLSGLWLDNARERVVVAVTDDPSKHRTYLTANAKHPELIEVIRRRFTKAELTSLSGQISKDRDVLAARGIDLQSVGTDIVAGRVEVTVRGVTQDEAAYLCGTYGANLIVREGIVSPAAVPPG